MDNKLTKKTIALVIAAALVGGIGGSLFTGATVSAAPNSGFFDNLRSFLGFPAETASLRQTPTPAPAYTAEVDYENAVIKAVKNASPAVVSIVISKNVPTIEQCQTNPFADLPPEFQQFFGQDFGAVTVPCEGTKTRRQEVGGGSGFIVSPDGLIATNKHVVADTQASYTVFTNDGRKFDAKVAARDPARDVAIIKINAANLPTVVFTDSGSVKLGQTAIAIGNALGEFRNTVSVGVVSGLSRSITAEGAGLTENIEGLIQTDAAINPGNSGGPLLNLKGEVIGMDTAMVSGAQNIGFAIPVNQVRAALQSVEKSGRIIVPFLGVRYTLITPDLASKNNLPADHGAWVRGSKNQAAVVLNSPAAKAGVKDGDIITAINNENVTLDNSLATLIQKYNAGDTVTLTILRSGKVETVSVILEERK